MLTNVWLAEPQFQRDVLLSGSRSTGCCSCSPDPFLRVSGSEVEAFLLGLCVSVWLNELWKYDPDSANNIITRKKRWQRSCISKKMIKRYHNVFFVLFCCFSLNFTGGLVSISKTWYLGLPHCCLLVGSNYQDFVLWPEGWVWLGICDKHITYLLASRLQHRVPRCLQR